MDFYNSVVGFCVCHWIPSKRPFLCLLRIKFWVLSLLKIVLDKAAILSYNTTPAEEWMLSSSLLSAAWFFWPHVYHLFVWGWPHMAVGIFFSALSIFALRSLAFLLCRRSDFWAHLPSENKTTYQSFGTRIWPHSWP